MRPHTILKSFNGAPPREVVLDDAKLAALVETNRRSFADEAALLRHLRRGRPVRMLLSEYRLRPQDQLRPCA